MRRWVRVAAGCLAAAATLSVAPIAYAARDAVIGSWGIACNGSGATCIATQLVGADPRGLHVLMGAILVRSTGREPSRMVLRVGPDIDRRGGFGIKLSTGVELRLPVDRCGPRLCEGSGRLNAAVRAQLARAPVAQVAWRMKSGRQMLVPLNLRGFARALAEVERGAHSPPGIALRTM